MRSDARIKNAFELNYIVSSAHYICFRKVVYFCCCFTYIYIYAYIYIHTHTDTYIYICDIFVP